MISLGLMHETGCSGLVHWDDPEGWSGERAGEGGWRGFRMGNKCTPMADSCWCVLKATAATAKSLQSCLTLCDPIPGILQARTLGGLPFPSPMHKSEKWKWSRSAMSDSSRPHGLQPTMLLHPWDFLGKSTGVWCHCLLHESHYNIVK